MKVRALFLGGLFGTQCLDRPDRNRCLGCSPYGNLRRSFALVPPI
jgi:hypothetical protein